MMVKHATFNVLIVPRAKRNEKQSSEKLYARITVGGQRAEISLGRDVKQGLFNAKAQRCLGSSRESKLTNDFIEIVKSDFNEIRKQLIIEKKPITPELIRSRFKGLPDPNEKSSPLLLQFYDEHNKKFKELIGTKNHSASTYKRHLTSKSHVKDYIKNVYSKDDLTLEEVNYKFLSNYEHYLKVKRGCNHNSTMKYIKNLGKIIRLAYAEGYILLNPFDKFKLSYNSVTRVILTQKEVKRMVQKEIEEDRLDRVRDLFVFCIYTGVAFCDVHTLKMCNIIKDDAGDKWIKNKRLKTNVEYMVPLMKVPRKIIKKYKNHPQRVKKSLVIPQISNQNYNAYLKELAIRCNINKNLTSHIARHTFATTITLENGVPLEVVSKMLGHTSLKTTQIYAKVHEKVIKHGMKSLLGK